MYLSVLSWHAAKSLQTVFSNNETVWRFVKQFPGLKAGAAKVYVNSDLFRGQIGQTPSGWVVGHQLSLSNVLYPPMILQRLKNLRYDQYWSTLKGQILVSISLNQKPWSSHIIPPFYIIWSTWFLNKKRQRLHFSSHSEKQLNMIKKGPPKNIMLIGSVYVCSHVTILTRFDVRTPSKPLHSQGSVTA